MANYDVNGAIMEFLHGTSVERAELLRELGQAMRLRNRPVTELMVTIASECEKQNSPPEITVKMSVMYGMALGILMEKELESRRRII